MEKEKWWKEVWSDWKSEPWFYIAVSISSAAVIGGATSYILNWPFTFGAKWWEVMTAFGTVGAVILSLALAILNSSRRHQEKEDLAGLYATSVALELRSYIEHLNSLAIMEEFSLNDQLDDRCINILCGINKKELNISNESLMALTPLRQRAAYRISMGKALIEKLKNDMKSAIDKSSNNKNKIVPSNTETQEFINRLNEAINYLAVGCYVCEKIAKSYATLPSGEELYGDLEE